jgi:hypothetical protein
MVLDTYLVDGIHASIHFPLLASPFRVHWMTDSSQTILCLANLQPRVSEITRLRPHQIGSVGNFRLIGTIQQILVAGFKLRLAPLSPAQPGPLLKG